LITLENPQKIILMLKHPRDKRWIMNEQISGITDSEIVCYIYKKIRKLPWTSTTFL
jgi:hypothetical protein